VSGLELADVLDDQALDQLAEALAPRLARALRDLPAEPTRWLTAAQVARLLGVSRDYVYTHADEIGAERLGTGPRARLRFDARKLEGRVTIRTESERSDPPAAPPHGASRPPARRRGGAGAPRVPLIPIRGQRGVG
jgi:excisionase family DNA binding protein